MSYYFIAFFTSLLLEFIMIPKILKISVNKGLYDKPNNRKIHKVRSTRLGGMTFFPSIFLSMSLCISIINLYNPLFIKTFNFIDMISFFASGIFIYLIGITDDFIEIGYKIKFIFQFLSSLILVLSGIYFNNLYGLFGIKEMDPFVGMFISFIFIIFITNTINLIDGIDGLASGFGILSLITYCIISMIDKIQLSAIISFSTLGTIIPFFYYNVFAMRKARHRIFMGDAGSLISGLTISVLIILINKNDVNYEFSANNLLISLSFVTIPALDTFRVFFVRLLNGNSPFLADKNHIHHKFIELGYTHYSSTFFILLVALMITFFDIIFKNILNINIIVLINTMIYTLFIIILNYKIKTNETHKSSSK